MDDSVNPSETPQKPLNKAQDISIFKTAQSLLSFVIGLVGLLTASGFVIVNVYLSKFSHIHGYSLNTGQYIAASVGLATFAMLFAVILFLIVTLITYMTYNRKNLTFWLYIEMLYRGFKKTFGIERSFHRRWLVLRYVFIGEVAFLVLIVSMFYGSFIYGKIPHYLGGGAPVSVYVIFKDTQEVNSFGFISLSAHPNVATGIQMLAELSDGILVYDSQEKYTAVIKNDEIAGILDADSLEGSSRLLNTSMIASTEIPTAEATAAAS